MDQSPANDRYRTTLTERLLAAWRGLLTGRTYADGYVLGTAAGMNSVVADARREGFNRGLEYGSRAEQVAIANAEHLAVRGGHLSLVGSAASYDQVSAR